MLRERLAWALLLGIIMPLLANCTPPPAVAPERIVPFTRLTLPGLISGNVPNIPAPPAPGTLDARLEMAELRALRSGLTPRQRTAIVAWDSGAVVRWNQRARELVSAYKVDPLTASRIYALLSLAQYDAILIVQDGQQRYSRGMPSVSQGGIEPLVAHPAATYPSDHAAIATASATVLLHFFPSSNQQIRALRQEHEESRIWAGANCRSDLIVGAQIGQVVADTLLERAAAETAVLRWDGKIPNGADKWQIDALHPQLPALPQWATLRPWLMERPDQFRTSPPPALGTPAFQADLQEVRRISENRTAEELRIARFWADENGTPTPPGHWNQIAADLITAQRMDNRLAARTFTYLNLALMDSGIAAWDSKYTYWFIRPWQADPAIKTTVTQPQHPSYPSGHATFSGAAAELLGAIFPDQQKNLWSMAEEAALSRVYGGIHYRFDGTSGLEIGRAVGQFAIARMNSEK